MITRRNLLDGGSSHAEYYAQFTTPNMRAAVRAVFGDRLWDRLGENAPDDLNHIPLSEWNSLGYLVRSARVAELMKACGDYLTAAGIVCILKQAAREAIASSAAE